jgi:hypothetical protein
LWTIPLVLLCGFQTHAFGQGLSALVVEAAGRAAFTKAGTKGFQPVQVNVTRLTSGDVLMTGPASHVKLLIEGKPGPSGGQEPTQSTIDVEEKTKVEMTQLLADAASGAEAVSMKLAQGQVISNVRKIDTNSERFEVVTPTAVAAVRGTHYGTQVAWLAGKQNPKVSIRVKRGKVAILDPFTGISRRLVDEGHILDIEPSGDMVEQSIGGGGSNQGQGTPGGQQGAPLGTIGGDRGESGEERNSDTLNREPHKEGEGDDTGGGHGGGGSGKN